MTPQTRQVLIGAAAFAVIAGAGFWIYKKNFAEPVHQPTVKTHTALGEVLAEETIKLVGASGQIVVITLEDGQSSELDTYYEAFKDGLKSSSIKILRTDSINDTSGKYGPGTGISGRRFVRAVTKYPEASAIVSLVGLPDADEEELKELEGKSFPKVIAFARNSKDLDELLKKKCVQVAIIPRVASRTTATKPKTPREWFDSQFDIVRARDTSKAL